MRPGVEVVSRALPLPRSAPTDVGVSFMIGSTGKGDPVTLIRSMTDYENLLGDRQGGTAAYDAATAYFAEGGSRLYVSRTNAGTTAAATEGEEEPAQQVVDPGIQSALDALSKDYGPGQVFVAHATLATVVDTQTAVLQHCMDTNRVAVLSPTDSAVAGDLITAAAGLRTLATARWGAMFAPSAVIPGLAAGTTRSVNFAPVVCGLIARLAPVANANVPAAGENGQAVYALDLANRYTDQEYQDLNDGGVNLARLIYGGVRAYGWRSLVDPTGPDAAWLSFGNVRLNMQITALAEEIGERYVFTMIDGRRRTIAQFGADLRAMLVPFYDAGALYGATPQEAFIVDVGTAVNTEATIAAGELHAVLQVRMSPFAEYVRIEIVKVATTQALAA